MDRASIVFCTISLIGSLIIAALAYPFAALSPADLATWRTPVEADAMADVNLGDFGSVSVLELIDYYMENPPTPPVVGAAPEREVRFQGC